MSETNQDLLRAMEALSRHIEEHERKGRNYDQATWYVIEKLEAELDELRKEAERDYRDMRRFQAQFIEADQRRRGLEARVERLQRALDGVLRACELVVIEEGFDSESEGRRWVSDFASELQHDLREAGIGPSGPGGGER